MTPEDERIAKDHADSEQRIAQALAADLEVWRNGMSQRMEKFERALAENTATTQRVDENTSELVSILNSWKGAMVVFEFLGKIAKPVAAVLGLLTALWAWRSQK